MNFVSMPHLSRLEFALLCSLAFVIPLAEAPKNIFLLLFVLCFVIRNRASILNTRFGWDDFFWLGLGMLGIIQAPFAFFSVDSGAHADLLRLALLGWCLGRSNYSSQQIHTLLLAVIAGTLLAIGHGMWMLWVSKQRVFLELYSVGHVNHSAIYVLLAWAATLAWIWHELSAAVIVRIRLLASAVVATALTSVIAFGESRGAALTAAVMLASFIILLLWTKKVRIGRVLMTLALMSIPFALMLHDSRVIQKQQANDQASNVLSYRDKLWHNTYIAAYINPLHGLGKDNYHHISYDLVAAAAKKHALAFEETRTTFFGSSHAHNVFFTWLGERGLIGLGFLLGFLGWWLVRVIQAARQNQPQMLTVAAGMAWVVVVVSGLFNTTLHHEHGLLAMLLLGLGLSTRRQYAHDKPPQA